MCDGRMIAKTFQSTFNSEESKTDIEIGNIYEMVYCIADFATVAGFPRNVSMTTSNRYIVEVGAQIYATYWKSSFSTEIGVQQSVSVTHGVHEPSPRGAHINDPLSHRLCRL